MQTYLVAFVIIHEEGHSHSSSMEKMPIGEIVTEAVVRRWESELLRFYQSLNTPTVRVLSFQTL